MFSARKIFKSHRLLFAALLLFAGATFARAARAPVILSTLDFQGARATVAYGINANGDVVGTYVDQNGTNHGFRLTEGQYMSIDPPGSLFTEARGINANGDIVGDYVAKDGNLHGFFLGPDGFKDISVSGHLNTIPVKISAEGVIVGCYHDTDTMGTMHGWVRNEDGLTVYSTPASMHNGITPRGDVAGFYTDLMTMRTHGYILSNGATTQVDFPG
jgi:probable HAF family extracellular repeat protein